MVVDTSRCDAIVPGQHSSCTRRNSLLTHRAAPFSFFHRSLHTTQCGICSSTEVLPSHAGTGGGLTGSAGGCRTTAVGFGLSSVVAGFVDTGAAVLIDPDEVDDPADERELKVYFFASFFARLCPTKTGLSSSSSSSVLSSTSIVSSAGFAFALPFAVLFVRVVGRVVALLAPARGIQRPLEEVPGTETSASSPGAAATGTPDVGCLDFDLGRACRGYATSSMPSEELLARGDGRDGPASGWSMVV